jgi:hypothetical protein
MLPILCMLLLLSFGLLDLARADDPGAGSPEVWVPGAGVPAGGGGGPNGGGNGSNDIIITDLMSYDDPIFHLEEVADLINEDHFIVHGGLKDENGKPVVLDVLKRSDTYISATSVCVGDLSEESADDLEAWIADGTKGTCMVTFHSGKLDVTDIIKYAFHAQPDLEKFGIYHVEFDKNSNKLRKVMIMVERESAVGDPLQYKLDFIVEEIKAKP